MNNSIALYEFLNRQRDSNPRSSGLEHNPRSLPFARKLSYENRRLHQTMERELHEKKKLSQENEELQWKIRQSFVANDSSMLTTRYLRRVRNFKLSIFLPAESTFSGIFH
jgi:hypothetical protein